MRRALPTFLLLAVCVALLVSCETGKYNGGRYGSNRDFIDETDAGDLTMLKRMYENEGFDTSWINAEQSGLILSSPDLKGKVLVQVIEKNKCIRLAELYRKRQGLWPTADTYRRINTLNYDRLPKAYLDTEGDFWVEHYIPYRYGISRDGLVFFTKSFATMATEVALTFADYIQ